jgi:hypothetical protein
LRLILRSVRERRGNAGAGLVQHLSEGNVPPDAFPAGPGKQQELSLVESAEFPPFLGKDLATCLLDFQVGARYARPPGP